MCGPEYESLRLISAIVARRSSKTANGMNTTKSWMLSWTALDNNDLQRNNMEVEYDK